MASVEEPIPPEVELDLARYELRRSGRVERLEKLPMELLILLADRRGQLVSRAEIHERLWGKEVFVDADAAINTAVRKVRRALGDDPDMPRFLETVVGKGYRFVGPITIIPGAEAAAPSRPDGAVAGRSALAAFALVMLIAMLAVGLGRLGSRGGQAIESVAVLPFENVGGDPETEYLSDGISESLINRLSRLPHLKVIARASVFRYKGTHPDLLTVARELGVRAVVSGRVFPREDGLSVSVELMDVRENEQLWAATYDRP